jgi:prepilin peptidase CpaA
LLKISDPLVIVAVAGIGVSSAVVDMYTRRVPNLLTIGVTVLGVTLAAIGLTGLNVAGALGGFALGLALMLPGHLIGATGAGDVKLFAALGTLLGPSRTGSAFVYTALAGGFLAVIVARRRRRLRATMARTAAFVSSGGGNVGEIESTSQNNRFAYAPAIAAGALAAALGL